MPSESSPKNYYFLKSTRKDSIYEFPFMSVDETNLFAEFFNPILRLYPIEKSETIILPLTSLFKRLRLFILNQLNWNIELVKIFQAAYITVDTGVFELSDPEDFLRDVKNFLLLFEKAPPEEFLSYFFADARLRGKSFMETLLFRLYALEPLQEDMDELLQAFVLFRENPVYFQFLDFALFIIGSDLDEVEFYIKPFRAKQFKVDKPWLAKNVFDETAIEIVENGEEIERVIKFVKCKDCGYEYDDRMDFCPICGI